MGNPAYDARRAAEQAEHEQDLAQALAGKAMWEMLTALLSGHGSVTISPNMLGGGGYIIRLNRDA